VKSALVMGAGEGAPDAGELQIEPALRRAALSDARLIAAVEAHFDLVWRSLRRFGVPEADADDYAQHVFITLSGRLGSVPEHKVRAFLLSVAVKVAANARRKVKRSREVAADELDELEGGASPEQLLLQKQRRHTLDEGLALLTLEQRSVFVLFELEGFSLPEIAEALSIPLGTATSRLRRARDAFEAWARGRAESAELP
jgi:RNA polymerase sigma-70 factor, ECF subfamily